MNSLPRFDRLARFTAIFVLASAALTPRLNAGFLGFGAPKEADVNVVVDMTEDGRKVPPPNSVAKLFAKALAAQHYYVFGAKTPAPTIILVFHWGYMNPKIDDTGDDENPQQIFWNQKEMLALVAGNTLGNISSLSFEREDILQNARDDRYFAIVSAYDFAAAKEKKKKLHWQAKMSTPSNRVSLAEVIPSMITAGGPHFGRETKRPDSIAAPLAKEGKVEVGTPVVVPDSDKTPKPAPPKKEPSPARAHRFPARLP